MIGTIFKAYDVRATYPDPLNEDAAWKVGYATGQWLKKNNGGAVGKVLISRDMRPSSPSLCGELSKGIRAAGMNVVDLGLVDTSFQYFAINHVQGAVGGVQTTASHNPVGYNGFKISREQAKPVGAASGLKDIQRAAEALGEDPADRPEPTGTYETADLWDAYRAHVLQFLAPLQTRRTVFIDASNGMAGVMVPKVFAGVDNLEIVRVNFTIGEGFAHDPNPLVAENMVPTQRGVKGHGCELGACFDGDADRCMLVDDTGAIIGCDHLTALLAEHFVALGRTDPGEQHPATIVYDLRSSKVVEERIEALGAKARRSRVGHVFMKAALRETDGVFGGELSGHFYYRRNHFADSGAITLAAALTVLDQHDKPMSELMKPLRKYPQSGEVNFTADDKDAVMKKVEKEFGQRADFTDRLDGVTVDAFKAEGWWFNVRASNTEPLLRLNAEAKDKPTLDKLLKELEPQLGEPAAEH